MKIKKKTTYAVVILVLLAVVIVWLVSRPRDIDVLSINLKEHKNLALHIHPTLEIEILGKTEAIPGNLGLSSQGVMRVIHAHDETGKLHVESPYPRQFYLRDVFTVWDKKLTDKCIFDYCEDESHSLKFYVNGEDSELKDAIPLKDGDYIKIVYNRIDTALLTPKEAVTLYFQAWNGKQYDTMYSLISDGFKRIEPTAKTFGKFKSYMEKFYDTASGINVISAKEYYNNGKEASVEYKIEINNKDGTKKEFSGTYTLKKRANGWKMIHPYGENIDTT